MSKLHCFKSFLRSTPITGGVVSSKTAVFISFNYQDDYCRRAILECIDNSLDATVQKVHLVDETGQQVKHAPAIIFVHGHGFNPVHITDPRERLEQVLANPDRLYSLEPHEFESFVADVYTRLG